MLIRYRYKVMGEHTHVRVFCGESPEHTLAKCGDLMFRNEEFQEIKAGVGVVCEFIEDSK